MALFPGQRRDERILLFLRRHWTVLGRWLLLYAVLAALPFAVRWLLQKSAPDLLADTESLGPTLVMLLAWVYWMFLWMFFFASWIDYYFDYWVVTDRRVVSIEQDGLFSRTIAEIDLSRVQDATSQVRGLLPTFFHYGDAFIQSAGEQQRFVFEQIPNPNKVVALVMELHGRPSAANDKTNAAPVTTAADTDGG